MVTSANKGTVAMQNPLARRLARQDPSMSPRRARDVETKENIAAAIPVGRKRKILTRETQK
jgi:hypothetical protein